VIFLWQGLKMRNTVQIRIDTEVLSNFKNLCYLRGFTMTEILIMHIEDWVVSSKMSVERDFGFSAEQLDTLLDTWSNGGNAKDYGLPE
jgi:antitoxin component of RelBE/YafQ-DinJ toxin-antitoxin module